VASAQSASVVARASNVSGRAILVNAAASIALTSGYILSPGDRVDTRGGGRVVIELSDGSMVVVSPESVVTLKDYRAASTLRELFEITIGVVRVKINHFAGKPNPYRMNSPTASIAVRGTEFTIAVDASGATDVSVIEGAVEVTSRADPARSILLQAGQSFRLIASNQLPPQPANRGGDGRDGRDGQPPPPPPQQQAAANNAPNNMPNNAPLPKGPEQQGPAPGGKVFVHNDRDEGSPRANAGTYDRYLAGLADIGQAPFLLRFNAFPETHLDALENPAYASAFRGAEGRLYFLPTFHGAQTLAENQNAFGPGGSLPSDYSLSPQLSFFEPVGAFTFGGSASFSRVGSTSLNLDGGMIGHGITGSSSTNFYSGTLVAARRFGANSLGIELASLKGTGSMTSTSTDSPDPFGRRNTELLNSASDVTQTRFTVGYSRDLGHDTVAGAYYRYGFIRTNDRDTLHTFNNFSVGLDATGTTGHSYELGVRLRGAITPRLYYGIAGSWLGISLLDGLVSTNTTNSRERDRAHRASTGIGLGYSLSTRTVLTFDLAGGAAHNSAMRTEDATRRLVQNSGGSGRFVSMHGAVQHDLTRRLFLSASFLQVWQSNSVNVALFPDRFGNFVTVSDAFFSLSPIVNSASRFSDFGAGWRFTPNLWVQYIYSTDYGASPATHSLMLRYTFKHGAGF
jgi:hypothetical protein